jgi:hypothetical protein
MHFMVEEHPWHVILMFENENERRFKVVLQSRAEKQVTVVTCGRLNRRESEYKVTVDGGPAWKVILLAMPSGIYAWRIADGQLGKAGAGDHHASPVRTLRDGVIPYMVTHELRQQEI